MILRFIQITKNVKEFRSTKLTRPNPMINFKNTKLKYQWPKGFYSQPEKIDFSPLHLTQFFFQLQIVLNHIFELIQQNLQVFNVLYRSDIWMENFFIFPLSIHNLLDSLFQLMNLVFFSHCLHFIKFFCFFQAILDNFKLFLKIVSFFC